MFKVSKNVILQNERVLELKRPLDIYSYSPVWTLSKTSFIFQLHFDFFADNGDGNVGNQDLNAKSMTNEIETVSTKPKNADLALSGTLEEHASGKFITSLIYEYCINGTSCLF